MWRELQYALNHNQYNEHLVPVVIRACDPEALSWTLGSFQFVNLVNFDQKAYRDLFKVWGLDYIDPSLRRGKKKNKPE